MSILKKVIDFVMDILETVTFVGSLFIVVYFFAFQPHMVRGSSMVDTFHDGEYILTNKLSYRFGTYHRGDIVVFKSPESKDVDFIKRVIALPGESVAIQDGHVVVNGEMLDEPYAHSITETYPNQFMKEGTEIIVPQNYIFVMGDNRNRSSDSREFGPIPMSDVIGRVFFRYFPANSIGTISNPFTNSSQ